MLLEFEKKVAVFLKAIDFPVSNESVLLAVSGGADSIALLYVLHSLISQNIISLNLFCAHINHQLRNDSDCDEEFVISQAKKLNIPVTTKRLDIKKYAGDNKLSIETAARQLRIKNLTQIAQTNNCNWIATGHQENDNAETIIHRMLRGTGFRGLAGIWPKRKFDGNISFVRPLLCITREEIINYLKHKNLDWHEDYTNKEFIYTRNHIRHRLIPELQKQCKGSLIEQLTDLSSKAESLYKKNRNIAKSIWPEVSECKENKIALKKDILLSQAPLIQIELIRKALSYIGSGERDITSEHYVNILNLAKEGSTRKILELPGDFVILKEYENIIFKPTGIEQTLSVFNQSQTINLKIPGSTIFNQFTIHASILEQNQVDIKEFVKAKTSEIEWFDFEKINQPLIARLRKEGDKFVPFGQKGEKKIGKFLTAQRVPEEIRNNILILADSEKIIWLYPVRACEQTKVSSTTKTILQLHITGK